MKTYADIIQCSAQEARELTALWKEEGIAGVINLAHNIVPRMEHDPWLPVLHYPALDEVTPKDEWFDPILAFYDEVRKKGKVLVHCQAGGNRSVGTFGVLLVLRHGMNAPQALEVTGFPGYGAWRVAIENAESRRQ